MKLLGMRSALWADTGPEPISLAPFQWTFSSLSHSPYKNEAAAIFI